MFKLFTLLNKPPFISPFSRTQIQTHHCPNLDMLNPQRAINNGENDQPNPDHRDDEPNIRDIHALTPPHPPPVNRGRRRESWENSSNRSSSYSVSSEVGSSENFTTMSREFNALVLAGSAIENNETDTMMSNNNSNNNNNNNNNNSHLARIGEDEIPEETNPLAIVPNNSPLESSLDSRGVGSGTGGVNGDISVQRVKKEEVETKISAWQNAKISKINNRFKREEAIINGWESEQVEKANCWMKKVERKLEEKRARALEKMQNSVAKAHRKAEERKASSEAKRGTKLARVHEVASLMRAVGRAPVKRSFC